MSDDVLMRLLELIKDDPILHESIVKFIDAQAEAKRAYARWRTKTWRTKNEVA